MARRVLIGALTQAKAGPAAIHLWLAPAVTALALGLAAFVGTQWFLFFKTAPARVTAGPADTQPKRDGKLLADTLAGSGIFGIAPNAVVAQSSANVKLKGVLATGGERGSAAIVNTGGRDEVVLVGSPLAPGLVLDAVFPTHILVKRGAILERVNLEQPLARSGSLGLAAQPGGGTAKPAPAARAATPGAAPPAPLPPARAPRQNERREHSSNPMGRLAAGPAGPTVAEAPPGSTLAQMGLQPGDVIRSIDGHPVQGGQDVSRLLQAGIGGQTLPGEILRNGKTIPVQLGLAR
jgi:type II secretory pathway component PulC